MNWVFGYGSLIWRPSFSYSEARPAFIRGWRRQFWQGSPDHRGTRDKPGRVVTLVAEPGAICHGLAFKIAARQRAAIFSELDDRESGGYVRLQVEAEFAGDDTVTALTYFAPPGNDNFLGPAGLALLAEQILMSEGASGHNVEYVLRLAEALRDLNIDDDGVHALAAKLREALAGSASPERGGS